MTEFLEDDYCFACGCYSSNLERAHIVALSLGGSNFEENLHLLCPTCHADSEYLGDPDSDPFQARYYAWFFARTADDKYMSAACRIGFTHSDFIRGEDHLFRRALEVFGHDSNAGKMVISTYNNIKARTCSDAS